MSNLTKAEFREPGADQHVYIATPAHTIHSNFHVSLVRSIPPLLKAGIGVTYAHLAGHCHVDDARNLLVADFLKSSATDLLFWDADVAAEPGAALRLLSYNVDVVGGAYPLKDGSGKFPVKLIGGVCGGGLVEAEALPAGFLRIKRHLIQDLVDGTEWVYSDGTKMPLLFKRDVLAGVRIGGDYWFSIRARHFGACGPERADGWKIYVDPSLLFTHQGTVDFAGRLSDHLKESEAAQ